MKPITLIYLMHNRIEYTMQSLPMVLEEARRAPELVQEVRIYDDMSTDNSSEFVQGIWKANGPKIPITSIRDKFGSSTAQTNDAYKKSKSKYLVKVDNDIVIPYGYLSTLHWLMEKHEDIGFLMLENSGAFPHIEPRANLSLTDRTHIGGVGAFRRSIFDKLGPIQTGGRFFGFTNYQLRAKKELGVKCAMLKGANVMNLDASRAYSRAKEYEEKGWGRNLWKGIESIMDK